MAKPKTFFRAPFLKSLALRPERFQGDRYPFNLPILEAGGLQIEFDRPITFFTGDNGTGHGQAFLAWFNNRFGSDRLAIYLLDEPEAALSPTRQLEFIKMLRRWELSGTAQFIIATHSPTIMSYPGATLLTFDGGLIREIA